MKRRGFFATALGGFVAALWPKRSEGKVSPMYSADGFPPRLIHVETVRHSPYEWTSKYIEYDTGDQWPRYHVSVPASREVWKR